MSNVNWRYIFGWYVWNCSGGLVRGRGQVDCDTVNHFCQGNLIRIDRTIVVTAVPPIGSISPSAADLRRIEMWHWLYPLSVFKHRYPCHPSRHADVPCSNNLVFQSSDVTSISSGLPCLVASLHRFMWWVPFFFCCDSEPSSSNFWRLNLVLRFWNHTFT